jgi:phage terminase large subunit-like protein
MAVSSPALDVADLVGEAKALRRADLSGRMGPAEWAGKAVAAYKTFFADCIVAETNYGGAMVEETIRNADPDIPFREVKASRGKVIRAEPVAALYEPRIDKVCHLGVFPDLEYQMCMFAMSGYTGERSPDRADALVWALHHLMIEPEAPRFGFA